MDGPFDSAWFKWGRAVAHAQTLDADTERTAADGQAQPTGTIRIEYQPKRHGFSVWIDSVPDIPIAWSLMLGDVVSNFRASLDHLAWALVQRGSKAGRLNVEQERNVYFPIASSASHLRYLLYKARYSRLPGIRRADLTMIRRHQPYHRGKTRTPWHAFSILDVLSNHDKHREVQDVKLIPEIYKFEVRQCHDCVVTRSKIRAYRRPANVGTEIAFIRVRREGSNPRLDVECEITAHPAVHERLWLYIWLDLTTVAVMKLLGDFAEMPDEIETFGLSRTRLDRAIQTYQGMAALVPRRGTYPPY